MRLFDSTIGLLPVTGVSTVARELGGARGRAGLEDRDGDGR